MKTDVLAHKNCFITGASGGVGKEIAHYFAGQGCNLFLTGMEKDLLIQLQKELEEKYTDIKITHYPCNLNKDEEIKETITKAKETFGNIHILINCAGIFPVNPVVETTTQEFDQCFNINIRAPFIFCREFSKDMIKNKWGRIVNIGSSSAYAGFKETAIYCASKHAILGLSRSLHDEMKAANVRTFCVSPGSIKTEMGKKVKNQDFNTFIEPKELAKYIGFIVSFDGNMISEEIRLNRMFIQ